MTYLTSRSRRLEFERCPRSRYWLHEAQGTGYEPRRLAVPLATGTHLHSIFAALLKGEPAEEAIRGGLTNYDLACESRGLAIDQLAQESFVYNEQRALIEGLGWLAATRVIPRLLETYEILEVEKMDSTLLTTNGDDEIIWRSIPDALMRHREDGDLYILSWKTPAQIPRDNDPRTDMQGLSEAWALEQRLATGQKVRGIQMVYLLKGRKVDYQHPTLGKMKRHDSSLIWGFQQPGSFPLEMATGYYYQCSAPHAMRKSKWYPTGECPGDGRNHQRTGDWEAFPVWESLGVKAWIDLITSGEVKGSLDESWTLPIPYFRQQAHMDRWLAQTRASEQQIATNLANLRLYERGQIYSNDGAFNRELDRSFPMATEHWCNDTYGRQCPAFPICWEGVDPTSDQLYQIRTNDRREPNEPSNDD